MSEKVTKKTGKISRQIRVRSTLHGTADRPRLTVTISNAHISAQLIDDDAHRTIASATTVGKKTSGTMTDKAKAIGAEIAKVATTKKVSKIVFDRGSKKYHGRIQALADAARENGLEF